MTTEAPPLSTRDFYLKGEEYVTKYIENVIRALNTEIGDEDDKIDLEKIRNISALLLRTTYLEGYTPLQRRTVCAALICTIRCAGDDVYMDAMNSKQDRRELYAKDLGGEAYTYTEYTSIPSICVFMSYLFTAVARTADGFDKNRPLSTQGEAWVQASIKGMNTRVTALELNNESNVIGDDYAFQFCLGVTEYVISFYPKLRVDNVHRKMYEYAKKHASVSEIDILRMCALLKKNPELDPTVFESRIVNAKAYFERMYVTKTVASEPLNMDPSKLYDLNRVKYLTPGGYGNLFIARSAVDGVRVVVKYQVAERPGVVVRERNVMALLSPKCKYLLGLRRAFMYKKRAFIEMPYCAYGTLENVAVTNPKQLYWITHQIIEALDCLHDYGLVHNDVKPNNVFVYTPTHLKLADFGLATRFDEVKDMWGMFDPIGHGYGSIYPPERTLIKEPVDIGKYAPALDWWGLGNVMFYMFNTYMVPKTHEGNVRITYGTKAEVNIMLDIFDDIGQKGLTKSLKKEVDDLWTSCMTKIRGDWVHNKGLDPQKGAYIDALSVLMSPLFPKRDAGPMKQFLKDNVVEPTDMPLTMQANYTVLTAVDGRDPLMATTIKLPDVDAIIKYDSQSTILGFYYDENTPDLALMSGEVKDRLMDIL